MRKVSLITMCGRRYPPDGGDGRWMLMVEGAAGIGVGRDLVARGALRQRGIWSEGATRGYHKRYIYSARARGCGGSGTGGQSFHYYFFFYEIVRWQGDKMRRLLTEHIKRALSLSGSVKIMGNRTTNNNMIIVFQGCLEYEDFRVSYPILGRKRYAIIQQGVRFLILAWFVRFLTVELMYPNSSP